MSCGTHAMANLKNKTVFPCLCRGRACFRDVCRENYAARTVREIAAIERLNKFDTMFTLTIDPKKYENAKAAWKDITRLWHNLCRELRRIYPRFPYVWALETTEKGWPHLHISSSQFCPVDWAHVSKPGDPHYNPKERPLSELWEGVGGGCVVDARFIYGGVATYIGKGFTKQAVQEGVSSYITKQSLSIGDYVEKGTRVWGCSGGLKRLEKKKREGIVFLSGVLFLTGDEPDDIPVVEDCYCEGTGEMLTKADLDDILEGKIMEAKLVKQWNHEKKEEYEHTQQSRKVLGAGGSRCPPQGGQNLASCSGEQEKHGPDKDPTGSTKEDQRQDKVVARKMTNMEFWDYHYAECHRKGIET